ncbi:MAG TPA: RNA 2',3'-cyclic phosphodiesterase [Bryobacteraceae bacterium]|nr:RNA 2',3'-cyclic phosphodiesterase [Bryobacteraceae bacterium]
MRLFTAIEIPEEVKARLRSFVDCLRPTAKLSWSPVENLHVTTKFIGEWPEPDLPQMKDTLAQVPRPGPVEIAVRGIGWFPNPKSPRVLWAGIESGEPLAALARDTEDLLAKIGARLETRDFHPHLTLARRRDPVPLHNLRQALAGIDSNDFGSFTAASFFLYLSASGRYTKLQEFPLI